MLCMISELALPSVLLATLTPMIAKHNGSRNYSRHVAAGVNGVVGAGGVVQTCSSNDDNLTSKGL